MDVLIVGTGALATLFAWRLSSAGHGVTMLGSWEPGLQALREKGARLVDAHRSEQAFAVRVAHDQQDCLGSKYAIVLVKSWQTEGAARQLSACLTSDGLALTLQNGLGNYEILEEELGRDRVALGTTTTGSTLLGPGLVKPAGDGMLSIQSHARLAELEQALTSAGFKVDVVSDASALIWSKLVVNSAINPLTALLRIPNGELLKRPACRALMRTLAEETAAVARAEHITLPTGDLALMVEEVARRTASNYSSMLQDVLRGAPTEIEAICGAINRVGQQNGIATPVNEACFRLIQALTEGSEKSSEARQALGTGEKTVR